MVLTHALDAWPALTTRPWRDTGYLRWACGARLVPVETCAADDATQTYLSGSFAQRVMSLGDFIAQYFEAEGDDAADSGGDDARGYLAQHPLFDQVPALRRDIAAPFVCAARTAERHLCCVFCSMFREGDQSHTYTHTHIACANM